MNQRLAATDLAPPTVPRAVQQLLQAATCIVILLWAIRMASQILSIVLMGIMLGYCFLPLVKWFMQRWKRRRTTAIALSMISMAVLTLAAGFFVWRAAAEMKAKAPVYREQLITLQHQAAVFAEGKGIKVGNLVEEREARADQILAAAQAALPNAASFVANLGLMFLLGWMFLFEMVQEPGAKRSRLSENLAYYDDEMESYIGIQAKTGAISSLANLVLLAALGVDFPVLWAVLYFFLQFIPTVGFILSIVPPTLLALVSMGWERALMVAAGMTIINFLNDNVLTPKFMQAGVGISFLGITLSLLFWGFLLGAWGGVLAVPLTLALRKFVAPLFNNGEAVEAPSG